MVGPIVGPLELAVFAGIGVLAAAALVGGAAWIGRRAAFSTHRELLVTMEQERANYAGLRDEARDFYERADKARARMRSAQQVVERQSANGGDQVGPLSLEDYRVYLEKGGKPTPELDARFGGS